MNIENIAPDLLVHARGEGGRRGASPVNVGTVDHMDGENYIKLKKSDSPDGKHHWFPTDWVENVDENVVYLNKTAEEFHNGLVHDNPVRNAS